MSPDHYATLGLARRCTVAQIRAAYRLLAAQHHPDRNPDSPEALQKMQELNAAYETLTDPVRRRVYDRELDQDRVESRTRRGRITRSISQDVHLPIEAFFGGASLDVKVNDPASADGSETYRLDIPPETAPGNRFRLPRSGDFEGGFVQVRVKVLPGYRFKARGSDLRCDLRITAQRATQGGTETMPGPAGRMIRVKIPARVSRGETLKVPGEGLPKLRGGRGDLLVRITYRPVVEVSRARR
jgi:molecular chaperone DnaJ/curved DNA-binding protein